MQQFKSRKIGTWLGAILAIAILAGIAIFYFLSRPEIPSHVLKHFQDLEEIEFCSIHPVPSEFQIDDEIKEEADPATEMILGFEILGSKKIDNDGKLVNAIVKADRENNDTAAACFNPRHAIRDPADRENYLLICFECYQLKYKLKGTEGGILISDSVAKQFEAKVQELSMPVGQKR